MKFENENIDEALFNYFEGNLNELEKEELMNFIHKNPEYNDDFTSWAKSYAHIHENPLDYGITENLIKDRQPAFIRKAWIWTSVSVIVISLGIWYLSADFNKEIIPVPHKEKGLEEESFKDFSPNPLPNEKPFEDKVNQQLLKSDKKQAASVNKSELLLVREEQIVNEQSAIDCFEKGAIDDIVVPDVAVEIADTTVEKKNSLANVSKVQKSKRVKRRRGLIESIKPSSKILPINPDL